MPRATASPPATSTGSTAVRPGRRPAREPGTSRLTDHSKCVEDMSRWLIVHLDHGVYNGTRVLSAAGIDQLYAGVAPTDKSCYAMGWHEADIASALIVTHNGDPGDFHSTMVISPSTGWGVVLLMNGSNNGQARLDIPAYGVMAQLSAALPRSCQALWQSSPHCLAWPYSRSSWFRSWPPDGRSSYLTVDREPLTATAHFCPQDHPPRRPRTHKCCGHMFARSRTERAQYPLRVIGAHGLRSADPAQPRSRCVLGNDHQTDPWNLGPAKVIPPEQTASRF